MPFKNAFMIPIIQGVIFPATFTVTFILSTLVNKDIPVFFPYISDTGAYSIQKCIFTFMVDLGALFMFATLYIRYLQVENVLLNNNNNKEFSSRNLLTQKFNNFTYYLSIISLLGVFFLSACPVYPYKILHFIGAAIAFSTGFLIIFIQTCISTKIYPIFGIKLLNTVRIILLIITSITFTLSMIFGLISLSLFEGEDLTKWTSNNKGFTLHLISSFSEWIFVPGIILYIALYAIEFKKITVHKPDIEINI